MNFKLGEMVRFKDNSNRHQCYGNWVRNPETGSRMEKPDPSIFTSIEDIEDKLINIIEYGFDYFMNVGYVKAEKTHGKVILYDSDNFNDLCNKIVKSIEENDFTDYTDAEIMAMAKVMDFLSHKIKALDEGGDSFSFSDMYSYLQFNMDYKMKDGVSHNPTRSLPYN